MCEVTFPDHSVFPIIKRFHDFIDVIAHRAVPIVETKRVRITFDFTDQDMRMVIEFEPFFQ